MPVPSRALRDFLLRLDATRLDPQRLERRLGRLSEDLEGLRIAEIHADTRSPEFIVLLRFSRSDSPALARRMQAEAERLGAELIEPATLTDSAQAALYERLTSLPLRADVTRGASGPLAILTERLGIGGDRAPVLTWTADDRDALLRLYVRNAVRGLDAEAYGLESGRRVRVRIERRDEPPLQFEGEAVDGGARIRFRPSPELDRLIAIEAARLRAGRPSGESDARRACHLFARRPGLEPEPVLEIGDRSVRMLEARPIPEGAEVTVELMDAPDAPPAWTGVRLRLRGADEQPLGTVSLRRLEILEATPHEAFATSLERLAVRPPRVLAVLGDAPLRRALESRLRGSGIELLLPPADQAHEALERELLRCDALLLDLELPGIGVEVLDRLEACAAAAGLRITALTATPVPAMRNESTLVEVVRKGEPLARLLRGIDRCLAR